LPWRELSLPLLLCHLQKFFLHKIITKSKERGTDPEKAKLQIFQINKRQLKFVDNFQEKETKVNDRPERKETCSCHTLASGMASLNLLLSAVKNDFFLMIPDLNLGNVFLLAPIGTVSSR
jgi:hypothetical protein